MDRKKLCLGLEHRLESAGANLKALTQPRCADACGLEQGSIISGLAGTMGFTSSPLLSQYGGNVSLFHSHFTEPRGKIRYYSKTLADTISTDPLSETGGRGVTG